MTDFPPDNWYVETGTWGTDFDQSDDSMGGEHSIIFNDTSTQTELRSDLFPIAMSQDTPAVKYNVSVWAKASSITAGKTFRVRFVTLQADGETVQDTNTLYDGEFPDTPQWFNLGGIASATYVDSTQRAAYGRIELLKSSASSFTVTVNNATPVLLPPFGRNVLDTNQTVSTTAATVVLLSTSSSDYDINRMAFNAGSNEFLIIESGYYQISASIRVDSAAAATFVKVAVFVDGATEILGIRNDVSGGSTYAVSTSGLVYLTALQQISLIVQTDDSSYTVAAHDGRTYLHLHAIGDI